MDWLSRVSAGLDNIMPKIHNGSYRVNVSFIRDVSNLGKALQSGIGLIRVERRMLILEST